ncbi:MAG: hypothetical protein ACRDL7_07025, partial [Gaiellaceae bacterium]
LTVFKNTMQLLFFDNSACKEDENLLINHEGMCISSIVFVSILLINHIPDYLIMIKITFNQTGYTLPVGTYLGTYPVRINLIVHLSALVMTITFITILFMNFMYVNQFLQNDAKRVLHTKFYYNIFFIMSLVCFFFLLESFFQKILISNPNIRMLIYENFFMFIAYYKFTILTVLFSIPFLKPIFITIKKICKGE